MAKKVVLVGHCGPDSSYLRMAVKKAEPSAEIAMADDPQELTKSLAKGDVDLILFNRELGYGWDKPMGVDVIRQLKATMPQQRMMLVSNYPDAQQAAEAAGALPGFGKREIGTQRVTDLLKDAIGAKASV